MAENEIIAEIHRHREELARRCDLDLNRLMSFYREQEAASVIAGRRLVSLQPSTESATSVVRETQPEA